MVLENRVFYVKGNELNIFSRLTDMVSESVFKEKKLSSNIAVNSSKYVNVNLI